MVFSEDGHIIAIIRIGPRGNVYDQETIVNKQIITTPSGERLVVIPESEFEALVEAMEDREDVEAVRTFRERLAAGEEDMIPSEYVDRILNGENKIKVWREFRGMTLREIGEKAGVSTSFLSQIESGARDGSFDTIKKIAAALKISVDDLA